jgi:NADPH-dependent ferric siderophore reductase
MSPGRSALPCEPIALYLFFMPPAPPEAPATRTGGRLRNFLAVTGIVAEIDQIARRMQRIRIEGPDLAHLACLPGQHVRVHVADMFSPHSWLHPRDILRTYSVWQHDDGIELCVLDHEAGGPDHGAPGPGAVWGRGLQTGTSVTFGKPEGSFVLRDAPYHVFAGEETAAVAFGPMLRALAPQTPAYGILEVDEPADRLPLARELHWRYRHGQSAAASRSLLEAFTQLELPGEPGVAYLAGEAQTIQLLRQHLVRERGWPRQAIRTKPFWIPGKRGLD